MRVVFGIILALGGIWLMWLVITGLSFPWEDPNSPTTQASTPASTGTTTRTAASSVQASSVAPLGAATPGASTAFQTALNLTLTQGLG